MSRKSALLTGTVCIVAVTVAGLWMARMRQCPKPGVFANQRKAGRGETHMQGKRRPGAQARRIENFIQRVAAEDFQTAVANLDNNEGLLVRIGARISQEGVPESRFEECLANRRLAKIFAVLRSWGRDRADRFCRKTFQDKLQESRRMFEERIPHWEAGWTGKPTPPVPNKDVQGAVYALVFLSAYYCPTHVVLDQVDQWKEMIDSLRPRAREMFLDERLFDKMDWYIKWVFMPERKFLLNIYVWMLHDRCDNVDWRSALPRGLPIERLPFCAWDAKVNPFDFTHQSEFEPVDKKSVLIWVPYCPRWDDATLHSHPSRVYGHPDSKDAVLRKLREKLTQCARAGHPRTR